MGSEADPAPAMEIVTLGCVVFLEAGALAGLGGNPDATAALLNHTVDLVGARSEIDGLQAASADRKVSRPLYVFHARRKWVFALWCSNERHSASLQG
jgi:hypothetical protein